MNAAKRISLSPAAKKYIEHNSTYTLTKYILFVCMRRMKRRCMGDFSRKDLFDESDGLYWKYDRQESYNR